MEEIFEAELNGDKREAWLKQLDQYLTAIQRNTEEIITQRAEIDRRKAETWALLNQIHFDSLPKVA